jgi:hypothetical protein
VAPLAASPLPPPPCRSLCVVRVRAVERCASSAARATGFVRAALQCFIESCGPDVRGAPSKFSRGLPAILAEVPVACPLSPRGGPRRFRLRMVRAGVRRTMRIVSRSTAFVPSGARELGPDRVESGRLNRPRGRLARRRGSARLVHGSSPGPSNDAHRQRLGPRDSFGLRSNASFSHASLTSAGPRRSSAEGCPRSLLRYRSLALSHPVAGLAASVCAWFESGPVDDAHRQRLGARTRSGTS